MYNKNPVDAKRRTADLGVILTGLSIYKNMLNFT